MVKVCRFNLTLQILFRNSLRYLFDGAGFLNALA